MIIGIPRETKTQESRVALIPEHVRLLVESEHQVRVEQDAGKGCGFPDEEYEEAGAVIKGQVYDCGMVVRVKEPPLDTIGENQIVMGYLHIGKEQNPALLKQLLDKHATSYAYEEIRNRKGDRLVNLGVEAGIVGMYEGLRWYGKVLSEHGLLDQFKVLKPLGGGVCVDNIFRVLAAADIQDGVNIYILGKGKVSQGVCQVLRYSPIQPRVLCRRETADITKFLPDADIVVNAVDWYPHEPRIIKKEMLALMKKTAVIVDMSCDTNGAIESCIPTSWESPTYKFNGTTHFCVDNLPSAVPRDSSIRLSGMIIKHVLKVAGGDELSTGLMTKGGVFEYKARAKGL